MHQKQQVSATPLSTATFLQGLAVLFLIGLLCIWFTWRVWIALLGYAELNSIFARDRFTADFYVSGLQLTIQRTTTHPSILAREPHYSLKAIYNDESYVEVSCDITDAVRTWSETSCGGYMFSFSDMPLGTRGIGAYGW